MPHQADSLSVTLIGTLYFIFALQVFWQIRGRKLDAQRAGALIPLVLTFVLCGAAGYLTTLLPDTFWSLREMLHWMLVVCAGWLVLTNQARTVAEVLRYG